MLSLDDYVLSAEAYTVRLMLALLALPCERRAVDAYPGGAETPVLRDGDLELRDAGLILAHLARTYDQTGTWLPAAQLKAVAEWLDYASTDLRALAEARRVAVFDASGDLNTLNARGRIALRRLEQHLTERRTAGAQWIAGETPTIADIVVFPHVALSHDGGIGHEDYPAIHLWQRAVRKLPRFISMPGIPDYL